MNIYFAGSIRGGRDDAALYAKLIDVLKEHGTVLTEHVGDMTLSEQGSQGTDAEIFTQDVTWLTEADIVVAEVTNPSLGVGYELGIAERLGKKIFCLYRHQEDKRLSAMILGNSYVEVLEYNTVDEAKKHIDTFFTTL